MDAKRYRKIKIKKSHEGVFTEKSKEHGQSVQGFAHKVMANKEDYSSATVKQANFAINFGGKK